MMGFEPIHSHLLAFPHSSHPTGKHHVSTGWLVPLRLPLTKRSAKFTSHRSPAGLWHRGNEASPAADWTETDTLGLYRMPFSQFSKSPQSSCPMIFRLGSVTFRVSERWTVHFGGVWETAPGRRVQWSDCGFKLQWIYAFTCFTD